MKTFKIFTENTKDNVYKLTYDNKYTKIFRAKNEKDAISKATKDFLKAPKNVQLKKKRTMDHSKLSIEKLDKMPKPVGMG